MNCTGLLTSALSLTLLGVTPSHSNTVAARRAVGTHGLLRPFAFAVNQETDSTLTMIADALQKRGSDAVLDREWVEALNIPISSDAQEIRIKRLQRPQHLSLEGDPTCCDFTRTAILLFTDKRYLIFNVEGLTSFLSIAVDESANILGGRIYKPVDKPLLETIRVTQLEQSRAFWRQLLLTEAGSSE